MLGGGSRAGGRAGRREGTYLELIPADVGVGISTLRDKPHGRALLRFGREGEKDREGRRVGYKKGRRKGTEGGREGEREGRITCLVVA